MDEGLAKLTTCLSEIQRELTKPKDSAPNSSPLKASLARQEAQLQLLSREVTELNSQMETRVFGQPERIPQQQPTVDQGVEWAPAHRSTARVALLKTPGGYAALSQPARAPRRPSAGRTARDAGGNSPARLEPVKSKS